MYQRRAVQGRIKHLENNMLGLTHRLKNIYARSTSTATHNKLKQTFDSAGHFKNALEQQVMKLRNEIEVLRVSNAAPELLLA